MRGRLRQSQSNVTLIEILILTFHVPATWLVVSAFLFDFVLIELTVRAILFIELTWTFGLKLCSETVK